MSNAVIERMLSSFDQAASRGIPASRIVRGLEQKFGWRRERVIEALLEHHRIDGASVGEETLIWTRSPAPAAASSVEEQSELQFLQAAIDYAVAHGIIDSRSMQKIPATHIFNTLVTTISKDSEHAAA
ncbi:MAG: hypothetical protein ACF8PN_11615 [Phycisphaerales bacterium]